MSASFHIETFFAIGLRGGIERRLIALTAKQQAFIDEYLKTWNATEAASRAGYSSRTASAIGHENLSKPEIADVIKERLTEMKMSADEVLTRTADIARGNLSEWIDADGNVDIAAMRAAGMGHLIKRYDVTRRILRDGTEVVTTKIELYPADLAHDRLLRHHGLYQDRLSIDARIEEVNEIEIVRGDGDATSRAD